jgi:uncharacterized membrane protein
VDVFLGNFDFILFNSFLALVALVFGWFMLKPYSKLIRALCGFIWLIFLPNTIYILTDVSHLLEDWVKVDNLFKLLLTIQYTAFAIFGILTYVVSVYFFQQLLEKRSIDWKIRKMKPKTFVLICILNFAVGFAVILGGIERTNSWHILTDPIRVLRDILDMTSSEEMLLLAGGVGILANIIYFLMLEGIVTWGKKYFKP